MATNDNGQTALTCKRIRWDHQPQTNTGCLWDMQPVGYCGKPATIHLYEDGNAVGPGRPLCEECFAEERCCHESYHDAEDAVFRQPTKFPAYNTAVKQAAAEYLALLERRWYACVCLSLLSS